MYGLISNNTKKDLIRAIVNEYTFSCNHSPTCQARIIDIKNDMAVLEVVNHPESYMMKYNVKHAARIGERFTLPAYIAWNSIYF